MPQPSGYPLKPLVQRESGTPLSTVGRPSRSFPAPGREQPVGPREDPLSPPVKQDTEHYAAPPCPRPAPAAAPPAAGAGPVAAPRRVREPGHGATVIFARSYTPSGSRQSLYGWRLDTPIEGARMNDSHESFEAISEQSDPQQRKPQFTISKIMYWTAIVAGGLTITTVSFDLSP